MRSRVLGWDDKWLVIGSWFLRGRRVRKLRPRRGGEETGRCAEVLACCLSKYVFKKGRYTVAPVRGLEAAGWLPERPSVGVGSRAVSVSPEKKKIGTGTDMVSSPVRSPSASPRKVRGSPSPVRSPVSTPARKGSNDSSTSNSSTSGSASGIKVTQSGLLVSTPPGDSGESTPADGLASIDIPEGISKVIIEHATEADAGLAGKKMQEWIEADRSSVWEIVEKERLRGLEVTRGWMALDNDLFDEFKGKRLGRANG